MTGKYRNTSIYLDVENADELRKDCDVDEVGAEHVEEVDRVDGEGDDGGQDGGYDHGDPDHPHHFAFRDLRSKRTTTKI